MRVFCKRKDDFLGFVRLTVGELITASVRDGLLRKQFSLLPRDKKDKYAGGEVTIEASIAQDTKVLLMAE